jgi:hypothetical protein
MIRYDKIIAKYDRLTQETLNLRAVSSWEDNKRERLLKHFYTNKLASLD